MKGDNRNLLMPSELGYSHCSSNGYYTTIGYLAVDLMGVEDDFPHQMIIGCDPVPALDLA